MHGSFKLRYTSITSDYVPKHMSDVLRTGLQAIDAECESAAKIELEKLLGDPSSGQKPNIPSPQAVEAIWLRLISRKEHEFVQEISRILKPAHLPSHPSTRKEQLVEVETLVSEMLAEDRYEDRMQCFFRETARSTPGHVPFKDSQAKRLELIDATYRTGVRDALRRARQNILAELNLYKGRETAKDTDFLTMWRRYSTLSPWRSIGTIVLLSLTSYLIAFIIASDTFRALLERFGFSSGTGL
jgi:hypothetical protein